MCFVCKEYLWDKCHMVTFLMFLYKDFFFFTLLSFATSLKRRHFASSRGIRTHDFTLVHVGCVTGELWVPLSLSLGLHLCWFVKSVCVLPLSPAWPVDVKYELTLYIASLGLLCSRLMQWSIFFIDVSTTDFKLKETAVKPNELFFLSNVK